MDYEKKYKEALERARIWKDKGGMPKYKQGILDDIFPELKESEDGRIRKALIRFHKSTIDIDGIKGEDIIAWLEKQGEKQQKTPIWKHWKDGIAGNGEGKSIYLIKSGNTYSLSSCLCFECDYIELSELDKLLYEKQGQARKITHEEICKSYGIPDIGEFSDGYHTFNGLYKQRMILFAVLVKTYKDKAWKSWKHENGLDCFGGGWFIVGIDTPDGTYTYHYEAKDWDRFDCKVLEKAKHWDGHDEFDVERLFSLVEKQGEQKPTLEFKAKDWYVSKVDGKLHNMTYNPANKVEPKSQRIVSAEAKEAMYNKPTNEEMKELLRTEYEKGRADAIAEMQVAWSEEDIRLQRKLIELIYSVSYCDERENLSNWLKSLKDRITWKPSDEQIRALEYIINNAHNTSHSCKIAKELLKQLKKLREE